MIVILKRGVSEEKQNKLVSWFESQGVGVHISRGDYQTIMGLIGDTATIDTDLIESLEMVEGIKRVTEPFKRCNRKFHPEDSVIESAGIKIGGGNFAMLAGPGSCESAEQMVEIAKAVKAAGANLLYGGALRSSTPKAVTQSYDAQKRRDLELLDIARQESGLPVATEIMDASQLPLFDNVDVIIVGSRNMQNYPLLSELSAVGKPVILKRSLSSTLEELLLSAEYLMVGGNENVILCERGIRTFSDYTRNTLDISAIPMLKELSHLPVIADPSHGTGVGRLVRPMACAATAAGADGLIIEVHNDPLTAVYGSMQAVDCNEFIDVAEDVRKIREVLAK